MKRTAAIKADSRVHIVVMHDSKGEIAVHRQIGGMGFTATCARFLIEARKLKRAGAEQPRVDIDVREAF